ncbi:MAG: hypothetical protein J5842_07270 [Lachnospiraceae bacterium]|nr:hypothetical protein [Lachnospiraceae bacterium]
MICTTVFLFGCGNAGTDQSPTKEQAALQTDASGSDEDSGPAEPEEEPVRQGIDDDTKAPASDVSEAGDGSGDKTDADTDAGSGDEADSGSADVSTQEDMAGKEDEETKIAGQYRDILLQYKQIQDERLSQDEVEQSGLTTELVQHGWPFACSADEVKYLFYDIDENGISELIITYYGDIVDIYGYDGEKVRYVFGCPYRGIAELFPNRMLVLSFAYSADRWYSKWYEFDTGFSDFFPVFEMRCDDGGAPVYYEFGSVNDARQEIEEIYKNSGEYPVWVYEWLDEITKEEYESRCPKEDAIRLPEGKKIADFDITGESDPVPAVNE